ncbi:hypothetical protein [Burkholderia gladioli]|uniref:hypothetical protein n=1 Tax=Burkholderia gladioli TaxID=28095 RepID=UPI002FE32745
MTNPNIRFFWIHEHSEIFVAESWQQILQDAGNCGSAIRADGTSEMNYEPVEYGELPPTTRVQFAVIDNQGFRTGEIFDGTLEQLIARWPAKKLPELVFTQYP